MNLVIALITLSGGDAPVVLDIDQVSHVPMASITECADALEYAKSLQVTGHEDMVCMFESRFRSIENHLGARW